MRMSMGPIIEKIMRGGEEEGGYFLLKGGNTRRKQSESLRSFRPGRIIIDFHLRKIGGGSVFHGVVCLLEIFGEYRQKVGFFVCDLCFDVLRPVGRSCDEIDFFVFGERRLKGIGHIDGVDLIDVIFVRLSDFIEHALS